MAAVACRVGTVLGPARGSGKGQTVRRLAIVGRAPGVGRTTAAINFATASARAAGRVLLVDAHGKAPIAAHFELTPRGDGIGGARWWRDARPGLDIVAPAD